MENEEIKVGTINHYFPKIGVAIVEVTGSIKNGDKIHITGNKTDFEQEVFSMQIEKNAIEQAVAGQVIGLKVDNEAREGDKVFLLA